MFSALYFAGLLAAATAQRKLIATRGHVGMQNFYTSPLRRMLQVGYCKKYDCYYPSDRPHWSDNDFSDIGNAAWEDKQNMDYLYNRNQHAYAMNEKLGYNAYSIKKADSAFGYDPYSYAVGTYGSLFASDGLENAGLYSATNNIAVNEDDDGSYEIDLNFDDDDDDDDDDEETYDIEFNTDDDDDDDDHDDDYDDDDYFSADTFGPYTGETRVQQQNNVQETKSAGLSPVVAGIVGATIGISLAAIIAAIVVAVLYKKNTNRRMNDQEAQLASQTSFGSIEQV